MLNTYTYILLHRVREIECKFFKNKRIHCVSLLVNVQCQDRSRNSYIGIVCSFYCLSEIVRQENKRLFFVEVTFPPTFYTDIYTPPHWVVLFAKFVPCIKNVVQFKMQLQNQPTPRIRYWW